MAEWRRRVALVPQDRPSLTGTPQEFFDQACRYKSQRHLEPSSRRGISSKQQSRANDSVRKQDPASIAMAWGLRREAFDQPWSTLSGGEAQRVSLSIALALEPEVVSDD